MKWYLRLVVVSVITGIMVSGLNALTTFINDSYGRVMILNKNDNTIITIQKNNRRRFDCADMYANFDVYVPQKQTQFFIHLYTCTQNESGKNGNPQIKFSDLESGQGAADLFTIIKNENPHVSMVKGLPMIQKKMCVPCHHNKE